MSFGLGGISNFITTFINSNDINQARNTLRVGTSGFNAFMSINQSILINTTTVLQFNIERWDLFSEYNTTTYRYTPITNEKYLININVELGTLRANKLVELAIRKNGVNFSVNKFATSNINNINYTVTLTEFVEMNGTTDYIDVTIFQNDATIDAIANNSSFSAQLLYT